MTELGVGGGQMLEVVEGSETRLWGEHNIDRRSWRRGIGVQLGFADLNDHPRTRTNRRIRPSRAAPQQFLALRMLMRVTRHKPDVAEPQPRIAGRWMPLATAVRQAAEDVNAPLNQSDAWLEMGVRAEIGRSRICPGGAGHTMSCLKRVWLCRLEGFVEAIGETGPPPSHAVRQDLRSR